MTGAGAASLAFGFEDTFLGSVTDGDSDGNADYYAFGRDPTEQDVSLDNMLQRMHEPDSVWSVESVKDNFEGAFGVEAVINADVFPKVEDIVFNDTDGSGNKAIVAGRPQSAKIYAGIDYLDGTTERVLEGFIPVDFTPFDYTQDGKVRYTLSGIYGAESTNTSITPSSVTQASEGSHAAAQDFDLSIDTTSIPMLQSSSLSISNIARFQRDGNPTPADAVIAQPEASLESTGIYSGPNRLERALGGADATSTQDRLDGVAATATIKNNGTVISTYNLQTVTPATYEWSDLIAGDTDTTENVQWNVGGEDAVTVA
ncbi:hypothetical protein HZS55_15865 [Halosimplex rubrum]|uniref:Uncharacterized protein n=1 Tax=Halosimplex rubrum TaxID=869889 RepID=A0A7D5T761_9EURY|nr:hypothetical protein [Halosimplex rubrum]QLH78673.1 hypothetical protein HZS55_15865 [Halosimplex rubrum]